MKVLSTEAEVTKTKQALETSLELHGLRHLYPSKEGAQARGLYPFSYRFSQGKVYAIKGPNGAGKTTLFKLISGVLLPQGGEIYLNQEPITRLPQWKRARKGLGYLTQGESLVNDMSLFWNLKLALEARDQWRKGVVKPNFSDEINEALSLVQLTEQRDQRVDSLSGGERRRAEIARVSLFKPTLLLLDEPFAAIDQGGLKVMMHLIKQLSSNGSLILLTDHQTRYVDEVCHLSLHLVNGQLKAQEDTRN